MKNREIQASFTVCVVVLIGVHCTLVKPAGSCKLRCMHNGVCDAEGGEEFCRCKPGTRGYICEIVDACHNRRGVCGYEKDVECAYDESTGGSKCICDNSTKIFDSETRKCRVPCDDDCQNGGICEYVGGNRFCSCKMSTSGDFCETVDDCTIKEFCGLNADVKCGYNVELERATCICDDENQEFDSYKRECLTPCNRYKECRSFEKCEDRYCRCPVGKSGENCGNIIDCVIGKYRSCKRDNGRCFYNEEKRMAECDCGVGKLWTEKFNEKRCRKTCKDDCAHNGICEGNGIAKFCVCLPEFEGDLCEKVKDCSEEKNLCGSGDDVNCVFDERTISKCLCDNSTKLFDYDEKICRVPCKDDCQNNGKCEYAENEKECIGKCEYPRFCFCKRGTSGDFCETVDDCIENDLCGTNTDVKCVYDETKAEATCKCDDPKKSFDTNAKMCKPFCKTDTDCLTTERCTEDGDGKEICVCKAGRSGDECQFVDDCLTGKYSDCNGGNGRCSYNEVKETAECDCGIGKRWDESRNECRFTCKDDCLNNGSCEGEDDAKFCRCKTGTSGDHCEVVHDCDWAEICGNSTDVKCMFDESTGGGNCVCHNTTKIFDYHRKECRVTCNDNCANQGDCLAVGKYKFCKCRPGTSGDFCTIPNDCTKPDFCGTKTDVKCVYDRKSETSLCKCDDPTKRFDSTKQECRGICTNNTCQTGEITAGSDGGQAKCYCGVPYSGEKCEDDGVCFCLRHCP